MIFKETVVKVIVIGSKLVNVQINDSCEFTIYPQSYYCFIKDAKGVFEITKIYCQSTGANIPFTAAGFNIPAYDYAYDFEILVDAEFEEIKHVCVSHQLNIPATRLKFLKPRQFYQDVINLTGFEHITFTYYVKKIAEKTIELHILNPHEVEIQGQKSDYKYNTTDANDLNHNTSFVFDPEKFDHGDDNIQEVADEKSTEENKEVKLYTLHDIMSDKTFADVELTSSDGNEIMTYRCVLSKYSPIFKKIFEEAEEVPIKCSIEEFDSEIISAALDFCYGEIEAVIDKESKLFEFAEKYCIRELKEACCSYFQKNLNSSNVCDIIKIAYANNFDSLKQQCKTLLAKEDIEIDRLPMNIVVDFLRGLRKGIV